MYHWKGIFLRLAATALFAIMTLCVRAASFDAPVGQIVFWRSAVALVPIVLYLALCRALPAALKTSNWQGHGWRSALGCLAMFLSFISLAYLPLSLASALGFLAPLLAVPGAMLFLRERPSPTVIAMSVLGFAGVVLMLLPTFDGSKIDRSNLIGISAGLAMAVTTMFAKVTIKKLTSTEHPGAIAFYFALICALIGLTTQPFGWAVAQGTTLAWLIGAGVCGGLAHITMTEALARAPLSTLTTFEYTAMFWALGFDWLFFEQLPQPIALCGALLIVFAAVGVAFTKNQICPNA